MAEVIDLCGSCDEDGAFPRESLAAELKSDGDSDESYSTSWRRMNTKVKMMTRHCLRNMK